MRGFVLAAVAALLPVSAWAQADDSADILDLTGVSNGRTSGVVGALPPFQADSAILPSTGSVPSPAYGKSAWGAPRDDFRQAANWSVGQAATAIGLNDQVDGLWRTAGSSASRARASVAMGPLLNGLATLAAVIVFFVVLLRREQRPRRAAAFR